MESVFNIGMAIILIAPGLRSKNKTLNALIGRALSANPGIRKAYLGVCKVCLKDKAC